MKLTILAQAYLYDDTAPINGTLVQLHNLAYGFKEAGIEVHYVAGTKDKKKPSTEVIDGVYFYWIQAKAGVLSWKRIMKYYQDILDEIKPDVVYVRGRNVLQYVAGTYADKHNLSFVWGTNGDDSAEFWKHVKRLGKRKIAIYKKLALLPIKAYEDYYINKGMRMADVVINQSTFQQRETRHLLKKEGIVLPSYFFYKKTNRKKENQVLWLAGLSPNKQPELFVELIKNSSLNDWKVVLGGGTTDKIYESKIIDLIKGTSINLTGKINFNESFKYYESSKIYINTSKLEADGLPNAYIQSWLSGTVVLSLYHNPNHWMETYDIGFCANGDFKALKSKLQQLINEPKTLKRMSVNAEKFATETFANPSIIDEYIKLFKASYK